MNDRELKFAKSTVGIPEVSTFPEDTVASDREATEGRKEVLEAVTLAQDNMTPGGWFGRRSRYLYGRLAHRAWYKYQPINRSTPRLRSANPRGQSNYLAPSIL